MPTWPRCDDPLEVKIGFDARRMKPRRDDLERRIKKLEDSITHTTCRCQEREIWPLSLRQHRSIPVQPSTGCRGRILKHRQGPVF